MEDPGEEWVYEKINDSPVESRKSGLSWLWSNGLWLGRKVLVTSFVISCAPLVLPPLLVVSALGFAVSVPAGIAIASYTCAEKLMNKLLPAAASPSTMLAEEAASVEQNQQIGVAEKEQGLVSADMCVGSITDIGEMEGNKVSPAASFDKKYYAEDPGEYNGVEKIESHEIDIPKIEDFGEEEVKEPTKETHSPIEVKDSWTLVQEEPNKESPKKETNSPMEVKDGTSLQEEPEKESPKKETNSPMEVKDVGILVQEDAKEEPTNKETDSLIEVKDFGASVQEEPEKESPKKAINSPIEMKEVETSVQEDPKKESPKKETNSPMEVKDVGILVQEEDTTEELTNKETDSLIEVKDVGTLVQEDPKKEQPKKETNLAIEVKDVGTLVQEDLKKEQPKKETNSAIEDGTLVHEDPKKEIPTKETDLAIEVKDVETLVQEDPKEKLTKKETDPPVEVKDVGTLVQEDTKEEPTKKETYLPIEVKDPWTIVQEEPPKKETILPIEVKNVGNLVQEDTKSADTKKLAVPVMVSRETQGTTGKAAEVKILEETTGVLKNTRDGGISHEPYKKNKKKIKSSGLKTSHVVEGKKDHKTVSSTKEIGKSLEVGDEKLKMVDPNGLKADHIGEKTNVQVENLVPTVEMKKSVILESIVVEDRSTTKGDDKPIRYQSVSVTANQAGEDRHNVDENVKLGTGNKRTMKEIRIEDSAADDNFDKKKAIPASTKAKGTTGNVIVDKRRAGSMTGVPKDPVEKGFNTSKQDSSVHKALLKEKKLWDQVDALRLIVGYKAARQPSLIEELKVLYVFTGVELPSSFQDSDDIRGTEDKLHFLMSIVGVK